jgi:hypothetical protein
MKKENNKFEIGTNALLAIVIIMMMLMSMVAIVFGK